MRHINALLLLASCALAFAESPWTVTEIPGQAHAAFDRIVFVNDRVGWILADSRTILKTTNGGRSWVVENTNLTRPGTAMWSLSFADEKHGWAAGAIDQQPTIWETSDGGKSWTIEQSWPRAFADSNGAMLDIRFADATHGWAVGFNFLNAIIVATSDGGCHWNTQYSGTEITGQFQEMRCEDARNCWVLGSNGVMKTEDGGESWRLTYFDSALLRDIDVLGHSNVWVAGMGSHLLHGTRRGTMWREIPLPATPFSEHVRFASDLLGWAIAGKGELLITHDGGKTWHKEAIPAGLTADLITSTRSTLFVIANPGHLLTRPIK
jgi:photosystem II stability/assembly factor-like uncharacterized protein